MSAPGFHPRGLAAFRADVDRVGSCMALADRWLEALAESAEEDPALWITQVTPKALWARLVELDELGPEGRPLFGVPFAVKDNLAVKGFPTTAACPDFFHWPAESAPVVQHLLEAGAVCLGKTNLDQFATGLVGTRSPYGTPINPRSPRHIPGGSSSGSACAVARGLVPFALGTDTAGSGRVPAAFQEIYGWKPTRGLLSTRGLIPACRSLDCVSLFAAQASDLAELAELVARFDAADPWARPAPHGLAEPEDFPGLRRLAIPLPQEMEFFGDAVQARAWSAALEDWAGRGFELVACSFAPFLEAARLLYEGPWVAERTLAIDDLLRTAPEAVWPVTRAIIAPGRERTAMEAFAAMYRLAELRRQSEAVWEQADAILLPTTPTIYRPEEVAADPVGTNSRLGTYTNFFNLLDLSAVAVPAAAREDGAPFGVTLAAPAWADAALLKVAATRRPLAARTTTLGKLPAPSGFLEIAVCGAHLRGFPLEKQLRDRGAEFSEATRTAPAYRFYALDSLRPGLVRVGQTDPGAGTIEVEVWRLPLAQVGPFLAGVPRPLGLGQVELADGRWVCGFLCEAWAVEGCVEITSHGGWRAWCAQQSAHPA